MPPAERVMQGLNGWNCILRMAIWHRASSPFMPTSVQISTAVIFAGRSRFLLDTLAAVREIWPENLPLTARFGVIEYDGPDKKHWRNQSN